MSVVNSLFYSLRSDVPCFIKSLDLQGKASYIPYIRHSGYLGRFIPMP